MEQYHCIVNLDKREYIDPHALGSGLKFWEMLANAPGVGAALVVLLACSNGRGGGDLQEDDEVIGRWAGDRLAIVGDYAEEEDLAPEFFAHRIYPLCSGRDESDPKEDPEAFYQDISPLVARVLERELKGKFTGPGWRTWNPEPGSLFDGVRVGQPDMVLRFPRTHHDG